MKRATLSLLLASALAAGCMTKQRSDFVIERLVQPIPGGTGCTLSPSTPELSFASFDPTVAPTSVAGFRYGVSLHNHLRDNSLLNPILRTNSNGMIIEQAVMDYELIGGGTLPRVVSPANGFVQTEGVLAFGVVLMDTATATQVPVGSTVRVIVHIEGKLVSGSSVRSNEYEFLLTRCSAPGCDVTTGC